MRFNYIIFNNPDGDSWTSHADGYYTICMRDLFGKEGINVTCSPVDNRPYLLRLLYKIHVSDKLNNKFKLPGQRLWYPYYFRDNYKNSSPYCFVFISNPPVDYLLYLKERYPNARFVKFYRDLVSTQQRYYNQYKKAGLIDCWVSYDEKEARALGMHYYHEVESKIELESNGDILYDVFFAGRAKKRLPRLIEAYDYLDSKGINCFFYLTGVPQKERVIRSGIKYSDEPMTYKQMLLHNTHARCLLEINQENAVGYTSRFLESVMYNKRLITDNKCIKETDYYSKGYIQCIDNIQGIDISFIKREDPVDYNYGNEFSPLGFIEFLENNIL